jgi:predicted metal-dependent hydrolase
MRARPQYNLRPLHDYPGAFGAWLRLFTEGRFRASLDPLEEAWFEDRNPFLKGLIQLTVAMHQATTTNLDSGPRALFINARRLLKPYEPAHEDVDVCALRGLAGRELRRLARKRRRRVESRDG